MKLNSNIVAIVGFWRRQNLFVRDGGISGGRSSVTSFRVMVERMRRIQQQQHHQWMEQYFNLVVSVEIIIIIEAFEAPFPKQLRNYSKCLHVFGMAKIATSNHSCAISHFKSLFLGLWLCRVKENNKIKNDVKRKTLPNTIEKSTIVPSYQRLHSFVPLLLLLLLSKAITPWA